MKRQTQKPAAVQKLKWQFLFFGISLVLIIGVFTANAWQQIRKQELQTYQRISESAYNQLQARISEFLLTEDAKDFKDYQFMGRKPNLTEEQIDRGFLGYFQIDPQNKFESQFSNLLTVDTKALKKNSEQHQKLEKLSQNLLEEKPSEKSMEYVQLNAAPQMELDKDAPAGLQDDFSISIDSESENSGTGTLSAPQKSSKRSVYPNPFSRQEKSKKQSPAIKADKSDQESKKQVEVTASGALPVNAADIVTPQPQAAPQKITIAANEFFANTDPFQARLIGKDYIVFYRKALSQNQIYMQGFAVDLKTFLNWLTQESFADTILQNFTTGTIWANQDMLFAFGKPITSIPSQSLFQRTLGYPLSLLRVDLNYTHIPFSKAGQYLIVLSVITMLMLIAALFFIYRSVVTQIHLALKKEDFVASVTHELKTPLTSIRLSSELLNQGWLTVPEKISEHHHMIQKESERLSRLIDNVLSLARLEKKTYNLHLGKHDPSKDAQEFAKEFKALTQGEGFVWQDAITEGLPPILYDADALKQILFNLIENSLKFSKSSNNKKIIFGVFLQNQEVVWQIRDFGPGVAESELHKIFAQFYRIENELTRSTKGTGIGLSLVKTLAEQMHAKVIARNETDGGLCISLIFSTH